MRALRPGTILTTSVRRIAWLSRSWELPGIPSIYSPDSNLGCSRVCSGTVRRAKTAGKIGCELAHDGSHLCACRVHVLAR